MALNIIFAISGVAVASLIGAKVWEGRNRRKPFLLRWVSLGDEHVRTISHEAAHRYSEWKQSAHFFATKQLPLHTRNILNKTHAVLRERAEKHIGDIRGSKFLKKSDGISEFFKNLSDKENGRIDDTFEEDFQTPEEEVK